MAEIIETCHVTAYDPVRDDNQNVLVARVATRDPVSHLFRMSPEYGQPGSVRVKNGQPVCGNRHCSPEMCVHIKAYLAYLDNLYPY